MDKNKLKSDVTQILKRAYDAVGEAFKVSVQNLEMAIELSHADGDRK